MSRKEAIVFMVVLLSDYVYGGGPEITLDFRTPLCIAVEKDDLEEVRALVEGNADVNEACSFAKSDYPILIAARVGRVEIGELLLSKGADINQAGFLEYTPLLRAGEGLHSEFVELLLQNGADVNDKLIDLPGLNLNLGLDMLSLTTAAYLRKSLIASQAEQAAMDENYAAILELLFEQCFDFKKFGGISKTRLRSEGHPAEAALISELEDEEPPSC